ncbi:MAG: c-type cytochrome [Pseudomonadota bacterium]
MKLNKYVTCLLAAASLAAPATLLAADATVVAAIPAPAPAVADLKAGIPEEKPCLIAGWENPRSVCVAHTKTIAATCLICHGPNGRSLGAIPSLAGQDKAYLVAAMKDFKSGKRESTVMQKYAVGYSDQEYEDLAELFASIK